MLDNNGIRWLLTTHDKNGHPITQCVPFDSYAHAKASWRDAIETFPDVTFRLYELTSVGEINLLYDNKLSILDA